MNKMFSSLVFGVMASLTCTNLPAQESPSLSLADQMDSQGMVKISDGLFGRITARGESYIAVSSQGHQALLEKVTAVRDRLISRDSSIDVGALNRWISSVNGSDDASLAARPTSGISRDGATSLVVGNCSGPSNPYHPSTPFTANALANGEAASAYAKNQSTSPIIPTTNYASATVLNGLGNVVGNQSQTESNNTTASASVIKTLGGCPESYALGSITCQGASSPAISAFADATLNNCPTP